MVVHRVASGVQQHIKIFGCEVICYGPEVFIGFRDFSVLFSFEMFTDYSSSVGFEVLTPVNMNTAIVWGCNAV